MTTLPDDPASGESPDPYDLDAIRRALSLDAIDTRKLLVDVPVVQRPGRNQFFRAHPEWVTDWYTLTHESETMDRTTYWVAPDLWGVLAEHLDRVRVFPCIGRVNNPFIWPIKLPDPDGNTQSRSWNQSKLRAAEQAKTLWVKITGNRAIAAYEITIARGNLGEPVWPNKTFKELIELGFSDGKTINTLDHPVIREISGEI